MTNLVLQPAGDKLSIEHYEDTIIRGFDFQDPRISGLTIQERAELEALTPRGKLRLWGTKPGEDNRAIGKWNRIAPGDYVLFSFGKGSVSVARVISKLHNADLARRIWGETRTRNGRIQTWEYIYAVSEPEPRIIKLSDFNLSIGRVEHANIQEFNVLQPKGSAGGIAFLKLNHGPASPSLPMLEARKPKRRLTSADTAKINELDVLDSQVRAIRRHEQQALRSFLMAEDTATCALCGRHFPVEFLVAAHIKPRSKCTTEEKKDIANVAMPNCKLGCDELFGRGLISVDASGGIVVSQQAPKEGPVAAYIATHLENKDCRQWVCEAESRKYFNYHYKHEFRP